MWLHVPRELLLASAPASEDSTSDSRAPAEWSLWCTSSGRPLLRPVLWPGWKRRGWHELLSGTMYAPSTLAHGAALWISWLEELRARTSLSPGSAAASTESAPASFSSTSASPSNVRPPSSSGRTSPEQIGLFPASASTSKSEATEALGPSFGRVTLEPLTNDPESSSWPTPRASPNENRTTGNAPSHGNGHGKTLAGEACERTAIMLWATATATDAKASGSAIYTKTATHNPGATLTDAAVRLRTWPTPWASDGTKGGPNQRGSSGDMMLTSAARSWPTPSANDDKATGYTSGDGRWRPGLRIAERDSLGIRQVQMTETDGQESLPSVPISRQRSSDPSANPTATTGARPRSLSRLNPAFVEWLMGWPEGWTLPYVRTDCEPAETVSCQDRQPTPGTVSGGRSSEDEAV